MKFLSVHIIAALLAITSMTDSKKQKVPKRMKLMQEIDTMMNILPDIAKCM